MSETPPSTSLTDDARHGTEAIRLNKFLAARLGLSRREADAAIAAGQVTVNGKPAQLGARIDKNDKVCYNGSMVSFETRLLYVAFYKPTGYVCSRRAQGSASTLYELLPARYRDLKTVGRLDKDSSGLILLTNDGDFAYRMTHPRFRKEKVYEVTLDHSLAPLHQQEIADFGVQLPDGVSRFGVVRDERDDSRRSFIVTLSEGRNRQIRRTFAALGYTVTRLHRVQFGPYALAGLKPGEYVELNIN